MSVVANEIERRRWKWTTLSAVGKVITGNTPPTKATENYGNWIPFVRPTELVDGPIHAAAQGLSRDGAKIARTVPPGAVLVSCIGALGKTGIARVPVAFNQQLNAVIFSEQVLPEFGFYYAQTLRMWLYGQASATTLPIVNKGKFERAPFPLAPIDDQREIVAEIEKQFSRLDEAVTNLKRVKANLKRYKAAVLKAAVEGRLVPTEAELARREGRSYETGAQLLQRILETRRSQWKGKGKYKEPAAVDAADLPELPEGWVWASLNEIAWDAGYGTSQKCSYEYTGPAVLRIPNVQNGSLDLRDIKFAPSAFEVVPSDEVKVGDMLVIRTNGSKSLIGRAAVVLSNPQRAISFASYLIRFRLVAMDILPSWVSVIWQTGRMRSWIESRAATSAGQHNISMSVLATAPVPIPPLAEEHRIAAEVDRRLSFVREVEAEIDANHERAEGLRQSILQTSFAADALAAQ